MKKFLFNNLFFFFLLSSLISAIEYSKLDGTNNNLNNPKAGSFGSPYLREVPTPKSFFSNQDSMILSPGNYNPLPVGTTIKCSDPLPPNNYPLPRCISDIHNGYQTKLQDKFNWQIINSFKSNRKVSHMATFWGQMVGFDITNAKAAGEALANGITIPSDDTTYLSEPIIDNSINQTSLPFTRSDLLNRQGVNSATSFIDASFLYGTNETRLRTELRDIGNRGKMKLITSDSGDKKLGYPPKSPVDGKYILGITSRASHVFTDMIQTVLLREHNLRCDALYIQNGEQWNDDMYFQEARRWIIALVQKITFKEYFSVVVGVPLLPSTGYKPDITPGVDTFFSTVTMRYGHSEISNEYPIIDNNGQVMATLTLNDLSTPGLLENFDVPTLALSISSQRQEQVDPFYSDMMRNYKFSTGDIADIASLDGIRSRDRGIPLYNDIRVAYNFKPATDWSDITSNTVIQNRLKQLYTSVNNVEALAGALAEDHLPGSNFGPLIRKSMIDQFTAIRDSDRFYYESPGSGWSLDEINQINNITWRDIITRNVPQFTLPTNIWFVQPSVTFGTTNIFESSALDYPSSNYFRLSDVYEIRWKIVGDGNTGHLQLLLTMLSVNSWFGLGFNSIDNGMLGAEFIVVRNSDDGKNVEVGNYKSVGYQPPVKDVDNQYVEVLNQKFVNFTTQVELRRPLIAPNTKAIDDKLTTSI